MKNENLGAAWNQAPTILTGRLGLIKEEAGRNGLMSQLINGCIECEECRNEIRYGDEFNCVYCGSSLCDRCLFSLEDECHVFTSPLHAD